MCTLLPGDESCGINPDSYNLDPFQAILSLMPVPSIVLSFKCRGLLVAGALAMALPLLASFAFADAQRGTLVHEETIRVSPDAGAARLGEAGRGYELIGMETSRDWVHVQAILAATGRDEGPTEEEEEGK